MRRRSWSAAPTHRTTRNSLSVRQSLDALGRLNIPIVFDLEIGHVPPHLPLVNGALATVTVDDDVHEIVQKLE